MKTHSVEWFFFLLTKWGMHSVRKLRKTNAWRLITYRKANNEKEIIKLRLPFWGSFFNYVDQICPQLTTYLPPFDIGDGIPLLLYGKPEDLHIVDIFSTTYLPPIVFNVF